MAETRLIYGFHAVTSRLRQNASSVREVVVDQRRIDRRTRELEHLAEERGVRVVKVEAARLDGMTRHARHQGVAARVDAASAVRDIESVLEALQEPPLLLILDGITDPHNLGACLRVADALGAHAIIAPKDRAVGINATVEKVASGAAETVPFISVTNLARAMRDLKERGIWLIGADQEGPTELYSVKLNGPVAWVIGAEGEGMRHLTRETCDEIVCIPMVGTVESLNVAVSAGICLAESRRQRSRGAS